MIQNTILFRYNCIYTIVKIEAKAIKKVLSYLMCLAIVQTRKQSAAIER